MTKNEAIRILSTRDKYGVPCGYTSGYQEALDMAIEALKERPQGKWKRKLGTLCCSVCGNSWSVSFENLLNRFNYCPNCGADMTGEKDA